MEEWQWKALCKEAPHSHELNSSSSGIGTWDLQIWSGVLATLHLDTFHTNKELDLYVNSCVGCQSAQSGDLISAIYFLYFFTVTLKILIVLNKRGI